jgi:hypothetical protein
LNVSQPRYDRRGLTPGIVHIGLGNFHRAHMAVYLDDLFARGEDHDWAILGAGVRPADAAMRDALKAQDCLSTVIELDPDGKRARRVGAMTDFIAVTPSNAPLIAAMSRPEIRIVSLTVTEGGYFIDPATGRFDPGDPAMIADAAAPLASPPSPYCRATTCPATATPHGPRPSASRACPTPGSPTGSLPMRPFRTAWSTGLPPPPVRTNARWQRASALPTTRCR